MTTAASVRQRLVSRPTCENPRCARRGPLGHYWVVPPTKADSDDPASALLALCRRCRAALHADPPRLRVRLVDVVREESGCDGSLMSAHARFRFTAGPRRWTYCRDFKYPP